MQQQRTQYCGEFRPEHIGQAHQVNGWVDRVREAGGIVFVDIRDRSGVLQLVFDQSDNEANHEVAKRLAREFVIIAKGTLRQRESINKNMPTGEVELVASEVTLVNKADTPPMEVRDDIEVDPELRMTYRYIDLRRVSMQNTLKARHRLVKTIRDYFDERDFVEVETPILTKATPEGARDFIVPSRMSAGSFYALPQSPQIFKQILMVSGLDRYFQIVKCFRDEDKRADRQPEFTQLDMEMAFPTVEDVYTTVEGCVASVMRKVLGKDIEVPIKHIAHAEAMQRYGIDRPDVRFGMELVELTDFAATCGFNAFKGVAEAGGIVRALRIPGGHAMVSKGQFKNLEKDAKGRGAKGLAFIRYTEEGLNSPITKFFTEEELATITAKCEAVEGDLVLILADKAKVVNGILAEYRRSFAEKAGLIEEGTFEFVWVDEFPLFEYDEDENRLYAAHHPFTQPADKEAFMKLAEAMRASNRVCTPEIVELAKATKAQAYDLCLNGFELGGGSIRIHEKEVQDAMFDCLGIGPEEANAKFGFLLDALKFGAPPMGGVALGVDRFVMELMGYDNIQDVIAFPKTGGGKGLMDGSPAGVDAAQLEELHIKVVKD